MEEMSNSGLTSEMKRQRFLEETLQTERAKSTHLYVLTRDQYSALISQIKEAQKAATKTPVQQRRLKRFDIVEYDGVQKLILRSSRLDQNLRYFLPIEEIYDVIDQTHMTLNHAGRDKMMAETALNYANITREMVVLYLSMCEKCVTKKNKICKAHMYENNTTSDYETLVNSRCQIDIIDFQNKPDDKFKFIMVYQDHKTKFTLLRALETDSPLEIANNLIDIFLTIGAPCILQSNNRKALVDDIIHNATILWPELVILNGKISNPIGALENINHEIENYKNDWLDDKKSTKWSESLRYVQFQKNRTYNPEIKKSPFKALFGMAPKTGLGTIPLPPELLDAIKLGMPFKPTQPQIVDCFSVDCDENSSTSNIDSENCSDNNDRVATNIEATRTITIKEEVIDDSTENYIEVPTIDNAPKYVNLHDSNIVVDSEDIEVRAKTRDKTIIDAISIPNWENNQDASAASCQKSNVSEQVGNIELPAKKFKAEHHVLSLKPISVRSIGFYNPDAVQAPRVILPPITIRCSCATNCVNNHCACRKRNIPCNSRCHSNTQCFNKQ